MPSISGGRHSIAPEAGLPALSPFDPSSAPLARSPYRARIRTAARRRRRQDGEQHCTTGCAGMGCGAILAGPRVSAHAEETVPNLATSSHVRSFSPSLASVIQQAGERSATFRNWSRQSCQRQLRVRRRRRCRDSDQRACLVNVTVGDDSGSSSFTSPRAGPIGSDGSIGHELCHAIEVIDNRFVTSLLTMRSLYGGSANRILRIRIHTKPPPRLPRRRRSRRSRAFIRRRNPNGRPDRCGYNHQRRKDTHENRSCSQPRRLLRRRGGVTHPDLARDGRRPTRQQPAVEIAFTKWVTTSPSGPGERLLTFVVQNLTDKL